MMAIHVTAQALVAVLQTLLPNSIFEIREQDDDGSYDIAFRVGEEPWLVGKIVFRPNGVRPYLVGLNVGPGYGRWGHTVLVYWNYYYNEQTGSLSSTRSRPVDPAGLLEVGTEPVDVVCYLARLRRLRAAYPEGDPNDLEYLVLAEPVEIDSRQPA